VNRSNKYEVSRTWRAMVTPGDVIEIRAVDDGGTVTAGYFSNLDVLLRTLPQLMAKSERVSFTLNPVDRNFMAERGQRFARNPEHGGSMLPGWTGPLATDAQIERRRWLLVSFDPMRPAGEGVTDGERDKARAKAEAATVLLQAGGWPEPLIADAGTAWHVLFRVDLPADDGGLLGRVLRRLSERFSGDGVTIGTTANPAQLVPVYGSMIREGGGIGDRPYRMSKLEHWPNECGVVAPAMLEAMGNGVRA
jgi:hypothetical protein